MKKLLPILLFISVLSFSLVAQPSIQWQKCLGGTGNDFAYSIQQTTDGGYIVAGVSVLSNDGDVTGNHGDKDYWVVKLSSSGVLQWQKCLGGTRGDSPNSIQQTTDGGYIVAGYSFSNDGDVSGNHGDVDYWVVKLNSAGTIEWQKSLGGTGSDMAWSIQQTIDGGYIVAGRSESNDGDIMGHHGGNDYWIVKLSSSGVLQWEESFGGAGNDIGYSIQQTTDGGYIVAGNNGSGDFDYWIVKLSSSGVLQWEESFGGTGDDLPYSIQQTTDGGYIVAGYSYSNDGDVMGNHGSPDYWVVKLSGSGVLQWQKCLGGTRDDSPYSIQQTTDGGYIVAGYNDSNDGDISGNHGGVDYWVVKLDSAGTIEWQKSLGGTGFEGAHSIQQTTDGGYIVAGFTSSQDGDVTGNHDTVYNHHDYWVVKLSSGIGIDENTSTFFNMLITPNPLSHSTTISFSLSRSENFTVGVYDITGRLIANLFTGNMKAGTHELKWDVSGENRVDDGVYFLNFIGEDISHSSKIVVVK